MPRNVRNFWVQGSADGYAKPVGFGPRNKEGGFSLTIRMRENGSISNKTVEIWGHVLSDGRLALDVTARDGSLRELEWTQVTER